jgi:hypothetical protein
MKQLTLQEVVPLYSAVHGFWPVEDLAEMVKWREVVVYLLGTSV